MRDLARSGTTVLLTTQYLEEADALADQVVIISAGRVADTGTPAELKARFGTVVFHLGFGRQEAAQAAHAVLAAEGYRPQRDGTGIQVRSATGSGELTGMLRALDGRAPDPVSVAVREPTLDDVFLSLPVEAKQHEHGRNRAARQVTDSRVTASSAIASAFSDTADVAWRNLLTQLRTPQALVFATIQPVIFVLLFRYAFGGAIHVPGTNYVDFLMPGIFAQTVAFGAIGTAVGLSGDLRTGILVRFRTLPMARIAVLGGRTVADLARNLLVVAVMTGVGFAAGFRSPHGAGGLLAALGLVVAFGYAISWGFASLGLRVSDPEAAQAAAVPVLFLLVFTSAAFVPATAMPGWLQAFGTHQPVDALVNAERALILGGPAAHDVLISLAWSGGLLVVFALLAARTYARMGR